MLIHPIFGTHFNTKMINMADVIIPPYDAISKGKELVYLNRSPYNLAHILLPKSQDPDYSAASRQLAEWRTKGILVDDPQPSFYLYRQTFEVDGKIHVRNSLMCALSLHEFSKGVIRPHENTFQKYRSDRLKILKATQHQLSPIFGMVKDKEGELQKHFEKWAVEASFLSAQTDDEVLHQLWRVDGKTHENALNAFFEKKSIYIVDGHHRYSSALEFAKESGVLGKDGYPAGQMLFCIANVFDPALVIFPTHRVVRETKGGELNLSAYSQLPLTFDGLQAFVSTPQLEPKFAVYTKGNLRLCSPKDSRARVKDWGASLSRLAVTWSDLDILTQMGITEDNRSEAVFYERDLGEAWRIKDNYPVTVFHAPIPVERVCDVADENKFMPQKTTYFYPKLAAGLVIRRVS